MRMALADEDDDNPWTARPSRRRREPSIPGPFPDKIEVILGDQIYIAKENLVPGLRNRLLRVAAFQNPEFYRAQAMRLPTYGKPRIVSCAEDHPKHFALPRGCLDEVRQMLEALHIHPEIRDDVTEAFRSRFHSVAPCGQNSKRPLRPCSDMTPAFWQRPRPLAKPWWRRGSLPNAVSTL